MASNNLEKYAYHYHGDTVRRLFIAAGVVMVLTLPFFGHLLPGPYLISILIMICVDVAAGLTNPRQTWVAYFDVVVALVGFLVFEYHATTAYPDKFVPLYWITQTIALLFFIALYFAVKSVRGALLRGK